MKTDSSRQCQWRPNRREFLKHTAGLATGTFAYPWLSRYRLWAAGPQGVESRRYTTARPRLDLLDRNSPAGLEIVQLTTETEVPSSHIYMEAQIFTVDSKRFVLHRSAHAHGSSRSDPRHQFLLCDIENHCALQSLTDELGTTGPSISPDGLYLYYFVDRTRVNGGSLTLKRVRLDGTGREILLTVDSYLPDSRYRPSHLYPLSTISSDGKRLAISAFLGDGNSEGAPFGLLVFDVEKAAVALVLQGPTWCNLHPQFCRSLEPAARRDILVQENHGNQCGAQGEILKLTGGEGADIHVVRDDGGDLRNLPWGRDGNEYCQGHQCWRGNTAWAITSTDCRKPPEAQLIESQAVPHNGHLGIKTPGGVRNHLSRSVANPHFYHFATDRAGNRLISDAGPLGPQARIFLAELGLPGEGAGKFTNLLGPKSSCIKTAHIHPFLSPDGKLGFFNSDESGILQAYMIRGLESV